MGVAEGWSQAGDIDFCFRLVTWSLVFLGCYSVFKLLQMLPLVREPSCFSD